MALDDSTRKALDKVSAGIQRGDDVGRGELAKLPRRESRAEFSKISTMITYPVKDAERYGVIEFDAAGRLPSIEEKPAQPKSCYAVVALNFNDAGMVEIAAVLEPSARESKRVTRPLDC